MPPSRMFIAESSEIPKLMDVASLSGSSLGRLDRMPSFSSWAIAMHAEQREVILSVGVKDQRDGVSSELSAPSTTGYEG